MDRVARLSSRIASRMAPLLKHPVGWIIFSTIAYIVGMYITSAILYIGIHLGVSKYIDATSFALSSRIILYGILLFLLVVIPTWLRQQTTRSDMGLTRAMEWKDIGFGIAGAVLYFLIAMGVLTLVQLLPGINLTQAQDLAMGDVYGTARVLVFFVLVIITPFVEELLFRGLLYGGLRRRHIPIWASALIVSLLFGLAHGQLNVGIDVFCLSMVACYAREITGSIWAGVVLHMIKNAIAFAIIFMVTQG